MDIQAPHSPQVFSMVKELPSEITKKYQVTALPNLPMFESIWPRNQFTLLVVGNGATHGNGGSGVGTSPENLRIFLNHQDPADLARLGLVYVGRKFTSEDIVILNNLPQVFKIVDLSLPSQNLSESFSEAMLKIAERKKLSDILDRVRGQNKTLQELNENLGAIVEQRTEHLELSRREVETKLKEVRELIKFIKSLSSINAMEDIILILKQEFIKFHKVRPPLLLYSLSPGNHRCLYFQGPQIIDRPIELKKAILNHNDATALRELLADALERPFGSVLCVFMNHPDQYGILVFEHAMEAAEQKIFMNILDRQVESLTVAFDRIALKLRAHDISKQWSSTFDFLQDPIAIIDSKSNVIRSNKLFNQLSDKHLQLFSDANTDHQRPSKKHINVDNKIFEVNVYPIYLAPGEQSYNSIIHYTDITRAAQLQGQLIQSEKMSAIGLLAGNIAHELNNPLTGIKSLAQILQTEVPNEGTLRQDLKEVEMAAERSEQIIKNLLEFSSFHSSEGLEAISVRKVIMKTLAFLKTAMRYQNSHIELSEDEDMVVMEPHLLQQVIFNLVNNACQAMGDEGDLFLTSEVLPQSIEITVKDTGPGIPAEIRKSIFTPFFTTKEEGKGTGLGLSMSRAIVEKFGGQLVLKENVDKGSEFVITLPKVK
jgi:two-component system, NtrC family, sensor kinase